VQIERPKLTCFQLGFLHSVWLFGYIHVQEEGFDAERIDCLFSVQLVVKISERKRETSVVSFKRRQTMFIWIHGMQKFVLFVLGDVFGLHPKFRLCSQAYSAYLDLWRTGVCFVCLGDLLGVLSDCNQRIVLCLNNVGDADNGSGAKG
jgi:hypothetical protein